MRRTVIFSMAIMRRRPAGCSQPFHGDVTFEASDMPANCVAEWKDVGVSGDLPPGLAFADPASTVIAGTPILAGD